MLMNDMPPINRENLRIARENMGLTTGAASKKISASKKDLVADWEQGDTTPSWMQLEKLAKAYNTSELLFFSNEPISKNRTIPDYRVSPDAESDENVKKLINVIVTRQKWLEKNLREDGWQKNHLLGSGRNVSSPAELAKLISEKLSIDLREIKRISSKKNALQYLVDRAEANGIFVGKTISYHQLSVDDMRGLFVANDYCPFIILNRRDTLSAQIFSFIHELAHVFRKSESISNSLEFRTVDRHINDEEIFCNKVAAELLLPQGDFTKAHYEKSDIDSIAETYKVSPLAIFYRLKELGRIRGDQEDSLERDIQRETQENLKRKAEQEAQNTGGNYTNSMKDSNGDLFNRIVSSSYIENRIGYVEAANLLRFSPERI